MVTEVVRSRCKKANRTLSGLLQAIGMRYYKELPSGSASLLMKSDNGKVLVDAYDQAGKVISSLPNENTSSGLGATLERAFVGTTSPDSDGVIAIICDPTLVKKR
jgi:hypothetical protein